MMIMDPSYAYVPLMVASCAFFLVIYKYISPGLSAFCCPGYQTLNPAKQIEWNTRILSSLHAVIVSSSCIYVMLYDVEVYDKPVWCESWLVRTNSAFVIGYMLSDAIIMLRYYREIGEVFYIFHHGAVIYAYLFVMVYCVFPWFANYRLIAELSTPFVNVRWFMDALGCSRDSPLFLVNGLTMTVVFFVIRIVAMPWYWYRVYAVAGTPAVVEIQTMFYVLISSCVVLDTINLYWFSKIYNGAKKVLLTGGKSNVPKEDRKAA